MEINSIEELKSLIREVVREELDINNKEPVEKTQELEKPDNSIEVDKIREKIRAIPSTPLSPGSRSAQPTKTDATQPPTTQQNVDDMEI